MTRSLFVPLQLVILIVAAMFCSAEAFAQANSSAGIAPAPVSAPVGGGNGGAGDPAQGGQQGAVPRSGGMGMDLVLIMGGFLVLMIVMSMMAGRKEKRRRAEMMSSLRRHDKVLVGGGMIGTIVELKDDEVVVKVDEATNTRIRFTKNAIQSVLKQSSTPEESPTESVGA